MHPWGWRGEGPMLEAGAGGPEAALTPWHRHSGGLHSGCKQAGSYKLSLAIPCAFFSLWLHLEFPGPRHPEIGHLRRLPKSWSYACAKQGHAAFNVLARCPRVRTAGSRHCVHAGSISRDGGCFPGQPREDLRRSLRLGSAVVGCGPAVVWCPVVLGCVSCLSAPTEDSVGQGQA